jgi:hypothetical protein
MFSLGTGVSMKTIYFVIMVLLFASASAKATDKMMGCPGIMAEGEIAQLLKQPADSSFDRVLELQGIRFHITSSNSSSINKLQIALAGLEIENPLLEKMIDGTVTGVDVADLNLDGSPEVYVFVSSAGSGSYGTLVAYSTNRLKSISGIYLPPLKEDKTASKGYMGHDTFSVEGNYLVRRFPVYLDSDLNSKPTGGIRRLEYLLIPGDDGWILRLDKISAE